MTMVSYWKYTKEIHNDDGLVLIIGEYNHKNEAENGGRALGVHWTTYPQSRGFLSPCVIPEATRNAMLHGLLLQSQAKKADDEIKKITEAIDYFKDQGTKPRMNTTTTNQYI